MDYRRKKDEDRRLAEKRKYYNDGRNCTVKEAIDRSDKIS